MAVEGHTRVKCPLFNDHDRRIMNGWRSETPARPGKTGISLFSEIMMVSPCCEFIFLFNFLIKTV